MNKNIKNEGVKFSKDNQPDRAKKSVGQKRLKVLKDIANIVVKGGEVMEKVEQIANYLDIPKDELTVTLVAHLVQLQKAIRDEDTRAYNAVMDRILGKAEQSIKLTETKPIQVITKNEKDFKENIGK